MKRFLLMIVLLLSSTRLVQAACSTITIPAASFGTKTSFVINSTAQPTTTTIHISCTAILDLLTNDSVTVTFLSATPFQSSEAVMMRTDVSTTDFVPVRLCSQNNCAAPGEILIGGNYTWNAGILLDLLTSNTYNLPLYLYTVPGQNVSAGPYQSTLTLRIDYSICQIGAVGLCLTNQTGTQTIAVPVTLTVTNDCSAITAPNINFGSAPLVNQFPTIAQAASLTCTKGSTYTVGINNGTNSSGNLRYMANGSNLINYEIYQGNTANRWGDVGAQRWSSANSSSVSSDGLLRTFNYTANVITGQNTPPAGTYTDTLVLDVAF